MYNVIWTKEEIKKINRTILLRANLKLDSNMDLIEAKNYKSGNYYDNFSTSPYTEISEEIKKLFYFNDREKVINVLEKTKLLEIDLNNHLHFGFITNLSKIDTDNAAEIFTIFKEIVAQYDKSASVISKRIVQNFDSIEKLKEKAKEIADSTEITIEESLIKKDIEKRFIFAKGIPEDEIFSSLIKKLDSIIRFKLLAKLNREINNIAKSEFDKKRIDAISFKFDFHKNYQRKNMNNIKKKELKIYK